MPVKIPDNLPAKEILNNENIFVMSEERAIHQDIRPLRIAILNLMPTKIKTETQLLRVLGNSPIQVDITLLHTITHESQNTPPEHLQAFYRTFDEVKSELFDGLVVTGAPVEHLDFEEVDYWKELTKILEWRKTHVFSTYYICWAAQAALYHQWKIPKYGLPEKKFGVFLHRCTKKNVKLLRGFDDEFYAPHSRHTEVRREDIEKIPELDILCESDEAGVYCVISQDGRQIFVTGHAEYDPNTLKDEYDRDFNKGLPIAIPRNYYPNDDPSQPPFVRWRGHGHLIYANWLNYYVYQQTPYDLSRMQDWRPGMFPD